MPHFQCSAITWFDKLLALKAGKRVSEREEKFTMSRRRSRSRSRDRYRSRSRSSDRDARNRRPPNIEGMVSLKVDNLSYRTTPEELKPLFEKYGEVGDVYIPRDRFTKDSRGFAFVRYYDRRDAEDAMDRMDGYLMDGREMRVQLARYGRPLEPPHVRYGRNYIPPSYRSGYVLTPQLPHQVVCYILFSHNIPEAVVVVVVVVGGEVEEVIGATPDLEAGRL